MQDVRCVSISHVKRKGNHPAYLLAQYAKNIYGYVTQIKKNPNMVESALAHDVLRLFSF